MPEDLMRAATSGNSMSLQTLVAQNPNILLGRTLEGNTCLHLSAIHGHEQFCMSVVTLEEHLLGSVNFERETPLVTAVTNGHVPLASYLLQRCSQVQLNQAILQQDMHGFNALHHAIRCGHRVLALELIAAEPELSQAVSRCNESPMFGAAVRNFAEVVTKLVNIQDLSHSGLLGRNALHAAVRLGYIESATVMMQARPEMATAMDRNKNTPIRLAVLFNKTEVLRVLLQHDCSLGYEVSEDDGSPLLVSAAFRGHIDIAREILNYCPDAPYRQAGGWTWLHTAAANENEEFAEFILRTPQLGQVINMQDDKGKTALHYAVKKCNPRIVVALLSHPDIDVAVQDNGANSAAWELWKTTDHAKTLNWNEVSMLMAKADPQGAAALHNLQMEAKQQAIIKARMNAKSLTQTYTTNTSLVAILITTITFAAAFSPPGGYNSATGSEGLPTMSQKVAFKAFLISNTLAMCSSFVVAFICIIARWEDYEFLVHYRSFTQNLRWFAFIATTTTFSTGLYTVLAPRLKWLGIAICVVVALSPILTKLLGDWPVLKLKIRLGKTFNSDLLDMV
ncbi:ankyrin repeat-containing protein ITN1-like [Triticum dicoccoides]|uniref:ankyrin repeat-containing protein ITN1-like n=1 Tax=Triticum dicoccoides TaxID=85692 RepID=UPI0018907BE8|nr:ankyrin repeat-containing protein ITN1-like [Triticum dicoccoides]